MALRGHKSFETQLHETLYNNLLVLIQLHPPPNKDIADVLRKDMFVKNNRAAFIQVVYYLLYILNPKCIKEKIKSWPVYDSQYERQFRSEVLKYLNELNGVYENANMPLIMASQLVSPGGYKFAKYMLKLSLLVMTENLKQNEDIRKKMLPKPNLQKGCENAQIKRLNILTSRINKETTKLNTDFHMKFVQYKDIANAMVDELNVIQCNTQLLQENLKVVQSTRKTGCGIVQETDERVELLMKKLMKVKENCDKLAKIKDLVQYLTKDDLALESNSCDELNLISSLENFNLEMEKSCLEMTTFTDIKMNQYIEKFGKCNEELRRLKSAWINIHQETRKTIDIIKTNSTDVLNRPALCQGSESSGSTVLAVPLENSESQ